jgi:formylmethanofuran dehydrogenase subunit B
MKPELQTTCPFCSLHCADLRLTVDGGRLTRFSPACKLGRNGYAQALAGAAPAVKGTPRRKSISRLVSLLDSARRLLVVLSADAPNEAVESSLLLAQRYGALLAVEEESSHLLSGAMQTAGYLTGTLGELRDLQAVLLCGVEPKHTHPRLGDFLGADLWKNALSLNPPDPFAALRWLRLGLADPDQLVPKKLENILARTRSASSGVVFFGQQWLGAGQPLADELLLWLRDLNRSGRWYSHFLSLGVNSPGVTETLLSSAGYASTMRLTEPASATPLPHMQAAQLIESGFPDLCLLVGQPRSFSEHTLSRLRKVKTILLDPQPPAWKPSLWLPVAQAGVDAPGTMNRLDGLPLRLEPIVRSTRPSLQDLLAELAQEQPS